MLNPYKLNCRVYLQISRNWFELRKTKYIKTNPIHQTHNKCYCISQCIDKIQIKAFPVLFPAKQYIKNWHFQNYSCNSCPWILLMLLCPTLVSPFENIHRKLLYGCGHGWWWTTGYHWFVQRSTHNPQGSVQDRHKGQLRKPSVYSLDHAHTCQNQKITNHQEKE